MPKTEETNLPLAILLHGNHGTCGKGESPRLDTSALYTKTGACAEGSVLTC